MEYVGGDSNSLAMRQNGQCCAGEKMGVVSCWMGMLDH